MNAEQLEKLLAHYPDDESDEVHCMSEFVEGLKSRKYTEGWPEDKWQEEMPKHPLFANEINYEEELPPLVEAFQQLKYSPEFNTPVELAQVYKEDGNEQFKKKRYDYAIVAYTEGLKVKCEDDELNALLYTNRAAAHYNLGHYTKSLEDATTAKELNPHHVKAFYRGALCYLKLDKFDDCISWCDEGLKLKTDGKALLEVKEKALTQSGRKIQLKAEANEKKRCLEELNNAIKERGINIVGKGLTEESLECEYPDSLAQVHLTPEGVLMWPVVLLYPQYLTSDFIQAFDENLCFYDYFIDYFQEAAEWDIKHEYRPENLKVYFSDSVGNLVPVPKMEPLKTIMRNKRFKVTSGTLSFILTSLEYDKIYRAQKHVVDE